MEALFLKVLLVVLCVCCSNSNWRVFIKCFLCVARSLRMRRIRQLYRKGCYSPDGVGSTLLYPDIQITLKKKTNTSVCLNIHMNKLRQTNAMHRSFCKIPPLETCMSWDQKERPWIQKSQRLELFLESCQGRKELWEPDIPPQMLGHSEDPSQTPSTPRFRNHNTRCPKSSWRWNISLF